MASPSPKAARRAALRRLADHVLEAPDLSALTRLLTHDLPAVLGAASAALLLWDRKLESFEGLVLNTRQEAGLHHMHAEMDRVMRA